MEKPDKRVCKQLEELDTDTLVRVMGGCDMTDFVEFAIDKQLDGRKISDVTEGIVKLWRPKANAKKFISFIDDLKLNPDKYLNEHKDNASVPSDIERPSIESQYQTVVKKKSKEENAVTSLNNIDELWKRMVPAKSFLYRNQPKKNEKTTPSYLPMNPASPKKPRKLFRLSSYEYPFFDLRSKFSKQDNADRGYYPMKRSSIFHINRFYKKTEARTKYKSMSTAEELIDKYNEDHFYEDLCYNELENTGHNDKEVNLRNSNNANQVAIKPCIVKIQELFHSFKLPFFRRTIDIEVDKTEDEGEKEANIYEASDSIGNMYDSVHVNTQPCDVSKENNATKVAVEEYLEPVHVSKEYQDVYYKQKDDSLLGYIMGIFESRFGLRRVSVPLVHNLGVRLWGSVVDLFYSTVHCLTDAVTETNDTTPSEDSDSESHKAACTVEGAGRWAEERGGRGGRGMADRPLPVPVENETYYMSIDRSEAENLLKGQPDGMFVLRPSSQPNHAYTLSVSCAGGVHNVGVRRRADGRLALGFARRAERSFTSVTSLLRHHRTRRLLLVADGGVIGGTTLNETPHYYQTPSNIPVPVPRDRFC